MQCEGKHSMAVPSDNRDAAGGAEAAVHLHCQHDISIEAREELPLKRLLNKRGIEVTTRSERCVRYLDEFTDQVLAYAGGAGNLIRKAIGEDPSCLYAHTCLAASSMFADKAQGFKTVELHLQEARNLLESGTDHEVLFFRAVQAWRKGDMHTALGIHQSIAERYPRDIYSVCLSFSTPSLCWLVTTLTAHVVFVSQSFNLSP